MAYSDRLTNKLKLAAKDSQPASSDKQAYVSYLEVQLDRAVQAAGTVQGFGGRLDDFQSQLGMFEEKLLNLTRLLKAEHDCVESQEEGLEEVKKRVNTLSLEAGEMDRRVESLGNVGEIARKWPKIEEIEERVGQLEGKLQVGSIAVDNQEAKRLANYEAFVKAVEQALSDEETRLNAAIKRTLETIEDREKTFQSKVESALEQHTRSLSTELRRLEARLQDTDHRPKSPARTPDPFSQLSNRLEVVHIQEIESEMSGLKDSMRFPSAAPTADDLKSIGEKAWNAEQICNRLAEDTLDRLTRMDAKIGDLARAKPDSNTADLETKLSERMEESWEKSADLMRKYMETQRNMQMQIKELGVAIKRMEWVEGRTGGIDRKGPLNASTVSEKRASEVLISPRFPQEESASKARRSTSVPHARRPTKSPKHRSVSSSNTPSVKSPASPVHPSTAKSRAMDASIKKKLKEIKAKEKGLKTPEAKQKRYRKLEERRNDRLDQLYREYTAKYQAA
jgi:hypothetical protein